MPSRRSKNSSEQSRRTKRAGQPEQRAASLEEKPMEAKVDVRKLQILNDRINQTIDALNQVRLSVHGLGHTGGLQSQMNPYTSFIGQGYGMQQPYGMGAPGIFPGIGQLGHQGLQGGFPGIGQGLQGGFPGFGSQLGIQHNPYQQFTNPFVNPLLTSPWSQFGSPFGSPFGQIGSPWNVLGQTGGIGGGLSSLYGQQGGGYGGGLFHSGTEVIDRQLAEVRANDPFRITQTFPFVVS
jgi:hypothetical protein